MKTYNNLPYYKSNKENVIQFTLFEKKFFIRRPLLTFSDLIECPKICGLKLNLKGRLKGAKRARHLQVIKGKIKAQTFSFPVQAKNKPIQTKWGKIGLNIVLGEI